MTPGLVTAGYYGLRWQAKRDTALALRGAPWPWFLNMQPDESTPDQESAPPEGKAPSPLRSAGALHKRPWLWLALQCVVLAVDFQVRKAAVAVQEFDAVVLVAELDPAFAIQLDARAFA